MLDAVSYPFPHLSHPPLPSSPPWFRDFIDSLIAPCLLPCQLENCPCILTSAFRPKKTPQLIFEELTGAEGTKVVVSRGASWPQNNDLLPAALYKESGKLIYDGAIHSNRCSSRSIHTQCDLG